jgi:hypothetical protein
VSDLLVVNPDADRVGVVRIGWLRDQLARDREPDIFRRAHAEYLFERFSME